MQITFDVETNTKNKGNPFTKSGKLISYAIKRNNEQTNFNYCSSLGFLRELREGLESATLLIGFNIKFDLQWARRAGLLPREGCRVWDCQLAEFILSGQLTRYPSLAEALERFGLGSKSDEVAEYWKLGVDTCDIPEAVLHEYNVRDVDLTYELYLKQRAVMTEKQTRLLMVMGLDLLVLAEMEYNGIKFDISLCQEKARETATKLASVSAQVLRYSPTPAINLDSGQQLSCLLYGGKFEVDHITEEETVYKSGPKKGQTYMKNIHNVVVYKCEPLFAPLPKSETKLKKKIGEEEITIYVTDADTIKQLYSKSRAKDKRQILELLLERAELAKLVDTYYGKLPSLLDSMEWGEYLHGQYNQCVAATGRLSSSNPNMQNFSGDVDLLLISRYP